MLFLLAFLLMRVHVAEPQANPSNAAARACPNNWNAATASKSKRHKQKQSGNGAACIELPFTVLDVQEYLQSYGRKAQWKMVDEQLSEDTWSFSRRLEPNELLAATKDTRPKMIEWRSGIASVQVSSLQLPDGFTRSVVRASFRGYGESSDQFAPQKEYWELESNGSFEAAIVAALKSNFTSSAGKSAN